MSDDATSSPPQLPRRLRPSAVARTGTRHCNVGRLTGYVSPAGADAVVAVAQLDADRVPAAVLLAVRRIAEIVLLAQLVGDVRRGRIEVHWIANDLGAAA